MDMLRSNDLHLVPPGRLPGAVRLAVAALLLLGALALAGCQAEEGLEGGGPLGTPAVWADVDAAIASANCRSCHDGTTSPDMNAAADLVGVAEPTACGTSTLIVAGSPSTSAFYLSLTGGRSGTCSMSTKGGAASVAEVVLSWINNNAQ